MLREFYEMNTIYSDHIQRILNDTASYVGESRPYKKSRLSSKQLKGRKRSKLAKIARRNNRK